ncbi:MAG: hypothetical protein A2977_00410 [Alphaproteobacteria bacterium RIFCSPLOWO2_01_FULL_45_8]|nr:MAG: hypothetical protein A2065_02555 [Alphaproteobacteria bacterium GWB1_45_5]OFW75883.1 MAG: hypothetical protein A3K20_03585 [Alphaproteobacteria bacterium GWA1_45_9]OFW89975.1 MAG: hypothetical protein A2621_03790 [Alphaproteobacteria bacterium RIFCSPHIGHO2_01_FULL_41_14]OFW96241.1 MAG: hypothetical protein A2977_00410 [Alphaproteobacteria bacterium RIFCSPLOWO2_01_FULL_45_8]
MNLPFVSCLSLDQQKMLQALLKKYPKGAEKAATREILFLLLSPEMEEAQIQETIKAVSYCCGVSPRFLTEVMRNDLGYKKREEKVSAAVSICTSLPCLLRGGGEIMKACEKWLGLPCGTKTIDGRFSLTKKSCFNQCTEGPIAKINQDQRAGLTPTKMVFWLQNLSGEESSISPKDTTVVRNPYRPSQNKK